MKLFKVLSYLIRYGGELAESDGLREKDRNEAAQLEASARLLDSNLQLIESVGKMSAALEIIGKNLEALAQTGIQTGAEVQAFEDQLNEVVVRSRLISEFQVPNLMNLANESKRLAAVNPLGGEGGATAESDNPGDSPD